MIRTVCVLAAALTVTALTGSAAAYPHFQLSSDTATCSRCHVAPAGGGMLAERGRLEAGDTLSRGGDGSFLHGLVRLPDWLLVGGDLRLAGLVNDTGTAEGAQTAAFPMQADVSLGLVFGSVTLVATGGLKSAARNANLQPESDRKEASASSYLISREHYALWRPRRAGKYLRAGRFYAPYGLRLADHTTYVRRYLGFNLLHETYGVSGGWVKHDSELHVTAFVSDPIRWSARDERGAAVLYERRREAMVYGASSRLSVAQHDTLASVGLHAKYWAESSKLLWMGELNATHQRFADVTGASRVQLAAHVGPVWIPSNGVYASVAYELFDEDVATRKVARHAAYAWVSVLPRAHFEVMLSGRAQRIGSSDSAVNALLQVHYYP